MALPSQQVSKAKTKRKKNRPRFQTKLSKRLHQLQQAEAEASESALNDLFGEGGSNSLLEFLSNAITDSENPIYQQNHENEWTDDEDEYQTYRQRVQQEQENWKIALPLMFPEFMKCSKKTFQWGDEEVWNKDWKSAWMKVTAFPYLGRQKMKVVFCSCQLDSVRLVQIGLIGGSPKSPVTAFSIRLLRLFHLLWKLCRVRIDPFCRAIDEFLDGKNPVILSAGGDRTREWRKNFSAAVDAYREMLNLEDQLKIKALKLTARERLASNCPRCFGPTVKGKRESEPNAIICFDGNFQHRRHKGASAAWRDSETPKIPSLFLPQDDVDRWKNLVNSTDRSVTNDSVDPCTVSHTAADDARGNQTWRGCDETGLFGMACRHDHVLKFINIVQSGERNHFPIAMMDWMLRQCETKEEAKWKFGIIYDIGCNLEKGINKRNLFNEERRDGRLKFGTGAWHSYAHIRSCQIAYNPRLNPDWGMSDGEGMERIWAALINLIAPLRYSTKEHRLWALHLQALFHNEAARSKSVDSMIRRMKEMVKLFQESQSKLDQILSIPNYNLEYITAQWKRQRECQLQAFCTENTQALTEKLTHLIELEEFLVSKQQEFNELRRKRRRTRTEAEENRLLRLPDSLLLLEEEIDNVVDQLGADEFRNIPGASCG
ncbi:hypothetical protein DFH28DRAFT_1089161 [Melampsora americana]|nr:hypothetical protein DFH28DRAFT_1089161 [Melampsora americana]